MELTDLIKLIALDLCNWVAVLISIDLWRKMGSGRFYRNTCKEEEKKVFSSLKTFYPEREGYTIKAKALQKAALSSLYKIRAWRESTSLKFKSWLHLK